MSKVKIMVAMPTAGHPDRDALRSIMAEAARSDAPFCYSDVNPAPRDENRNRIAAAFLESPAGFDYLCMIDDDQIVPEGGIAKMLAVQKDIVVAPTPILMNDLVIVNCAKWSDDPNLKYGWPSLTSWDVGAKPHRLAAAGTGMVLIHRSVFERLEYPWFVENHGDRHGKGAQTEDVIFCERCHEVGIEIWCEPSVLCGHMKKVNLLNIVTTRELEIDRKAKAERQAVAS